MVLPLAPRTTSWRKNLTRAKVVSDHVDGARDLGRVECLAALKDEHELVEESQHHRRVGAGHRDLVSLHANLRLGK